MVGGRVVGVGSVAGDGEHAVDELVRRLLQLDLRRGERGPGGGPGGVIEVRGPVVMRGYLDDDALIAFMRDFEQRRA